MKKALIVIATIVIIWLGIRFVLGGPEDTWICEDGEWIEHGHPSQAKPTEGCGEKSSQDDLIQVYNLQANDKISSPLIVEGKARGYWFFEGDFPVKLFDGNANLLATAIAHSDGDWMTEDFVEFKAELEFPLSDTEKGFLVLEKDNPSGLPENADELRIPILFNKEISKINLYYYNANKDKDDSGNVQCSREGLVAVERSIAVSQTPIQDAIKLLLEGKITEEERDEGISSEYPLLGFSLKGAALKDGILTLEFDDAEGQTIGGSCRVGVLWYQIEATAKQFEGIDEVRFIPEDIFQP